jgi:diguanylate cyclase (GGDEF)-like protein/putative nucleotidyltransferase with HDIG domain
VQSNRTGFVPDPMDRPRAVGELIAEAQEAERKGKAREARTLYERALGSLSAADGLVASDLARWIGRTHGADGELEAGIDCAELALAISEAHGSDAGCAHALNVLGILHQTRGDIDEAAAHYQSAEERAVRLDDSRLVAMIRLNLGTIANIRGDFAQALSHYQLCLVGFRMAGAEDYISYVLNNVGMLYSDLGQWEQAERAFSGALESCDRAESPGIRVMVQVNLAELYLATGRMDAAEELCESAWLLMANGADDRAMGELCKVHGILLRERGELDQADSRLGCAARLADERGDPLLAAEVLREQAILFALQARNQETLKCLNRSHRLFTGLRARRDIADLESKIERLEHTFLAIVRRWGESIESADLYTQGHCVRVADHACALARAAGFDEQALLWFRMGALLHDVGKMVVPPEVLNKPGGFTPEERCLMERHPDAGVELLHGIDFPWDIRPMVRFHHERWSGGGYPTGIAGEEIPLAARILALADVFDALTTDRPYRRAYSAKQALEIMETSMQSHFDPRLLRLWVGLCDGGEIELPRFAGAEPSAPVVPPVCSVLLIGDRHTAPELEAISRARSDTLDFVIVHPWDGWVKIPTPDGVAAVVAAVRGEGAECLATVVQVREGFPDLPVIALLESDDEELALRIIQHGAQDCLVSGAADSALIERAVRRAVARGRVQSELQLQSLRDDLTVLHNRRGFFALGVQRLKALRRGPTAHPVILFLDLDGLKRINDEFGHSEGDRALTELAGVLRGAFRETDVIGRIGGDEFAILTVAESGNARDRLIRRIELAVGERDAQAGRRFRLSVSIGFAPVEYDDESGIVHALDCADRAMYTQKRQKRARVPLRA